MIIVGQEGNPCRNNDGEEESTFLNGVFLSCRVIGFLSESLPPSSS